MAQISVTLTADIKRLEKELADARKQLAQTGEIAEAASKKVARTGGNAAAGIGKLGKTTANAVPTLQEFSRVIQDAPFGIQGVGNNITQLVSSFGNLSRSTGGAVGALRLLVSSLAGPAGVLFAVSTVVSILTVFGDRLFTSKNRAKKLADELDRINKNFGASVALAESELELLELQGKETATKKQQLIGIIGAQAASLQAVQNQNEALLTQIKLQNEIVSDWELITEVVKRLAAIGYIGVTGAYESFKKVIDSLRKPLEDLLDIEIDRSGFASATAEDRRKEADLTAQVQQGQANINNLLAKALGLNKEITEEREKQSRTAVPQVQTQGAQGLAPIGQPIAPQITGELLLTKRAKELTDFEKRLLQFEQTTSGIIQGGILDGFNALGDGIANALLGADNALEGFANSVFAALGNFLTQLGQAAIATGIGMLSLKKAFANPFAAIAAGTALVAAGALLSKASAAAPGGGANIGGGGFTSGGGGSFTGASSSFSSSSGFGGTVVFEIQGQKLVGVLNRTLKKDRRTVADII